jgi:signal transduction histidine kinase
VYIYFDSKKEKKLAEITSYIKDLNRGNYSLYIEDNGEEELSILRNEIYKITVMLREDAENSIRDRKWQNEAITNIVKNCVEHSFDGGVVYLSYEKNKFYTKDKR